MKVIHDEILLEPRDTVYYNSCHTFMGLECLAAVWNKFRPTPTEDVRLAIIEGIGAYEKS